MYIGYTVFYGTMYGVLANFNTIINKEHVYQTISCEPVGE